MAGTHIAHGGRQEVKTSSVRNFQGSESRRPTDGRPHDEILERAEAICSRQRLLESKSTKFKTTTSGKRDARTARGGGQHGSIYDKQLTCWVARAPKTQILTQTPVLHTHITTTTTECDGHNTLTQVVSHPSHSVVVVVMCVCAVLVSVSISAYSAVPTM